MIFIKKHGKNNAKMQEAGFVAKITTELSPGSYFGLKNAPEFTAEATKIPKMAKKVVFGPGNFSIDFFTEKNAIFPKHRSELVRRAFGPVPHGRLLLIGYILRIYSKNTV